MLQGTRAKTVRVPVCYVQAITTVVFVLQAITNTQHCVCRLVQKATQTTTGYVSSLKQVNVRQAVTLVY